LVECAEYDKIANIANSKTSYSDEMQLN